MKYRKFLLIAVLAILIINCGEPSDTSDKSKRPHDPWVFRSVLDWQPRIVTLALHQDLWAAYSTEKCALYQAWKGKVDFDGAVYTTRHGPQPLSIGDKYVVSGVENAWSIKTENNTTVAKANYLGHRFVDEQVELMYELSTSDLSIPIKVFEKVEVELSEQGDPLFIRDFRTENIPDGRSVVLTTPFNSVIVKSNITTDGKLKYTQENEIEKGGIVSLNLIGDLSLNSNTTTNLTVKLLQNPVIFNPNKGKEVEKVDQSLPEGLRLIALSDCKTCHNKNVQTIGPSYVMIANRYEDTEDNRAYLLGKIKNGGSGIWGQQVMTPHPDLSNNTLTKMVEYILSLRTEEVSENKSTREFNTLTAVKSLKEPLSPGLYTTIREIKGNVTSLNDLDFSLRPIMAGVLPEINQLSGGDFVDLNDNFSLRAEGYLHVKKAGKHVFRLWSDDGSRLFINDLMVIDNDGLHGAVYEEASIMLEEGLYPIKIDYFEGGGGKYLSFHWQTPDGGEFLPVTIANLSHRSELREAYTGLTLPMASVRVIPGDKSALEEVHPSFDLYQARPSTFTPKVGGIDMMSDGSLIVSTWDPEGAIYRLENVKADDPEEIFVRKIASGLAEPLGLKVVDDEIYIMQKQEMTKLVDTDGDKIIDEYQTLSDDWRVSSNFHEFGFGLAYKDGYFYATLATAINPGGASTKPQIKDRGKVIKVSKETGELEFIASGLRTPNGIGWGYNDELFVADNQGDWLPSSKIVHVTEGAWFGSRSVDPIASLKWTEKKPVVWLPQDEIGNSPSTPAYLNTGPYKNQMLHGEVTHGGLKRVAVEEVDGQYQGALFRFAQGLEAGVNRIAWGSDGDLYIGGIGNPGNWGQSGKLQYGLQRLSFNGKTTFEMLAVSARSNGIEIEFTQPLQEGDGWDKESYDISQFYYLPTANYGGPKLGERKLPIKSVNVSEDRKKVFLELEGMKKNHIIYLHLEEPFISAEGNQIWTTECWYTMNRIPQNKPGFRSIAPESAGDNELTSAEIAKGWNLLFDGKSTNGWRNYNKQTIGSSWKIKDGVLYLDSQKSPDGKWSASDGGDIITDQEYENFELSIDWKISNCGNSGIFYNVVESDKYSAVYLTGPEMQILDNTCHPDTRFVTHRAGDLYDMIESKYSTVKPAGEWNTARIRSENGQVEFWLNGYKIVDFEMHNDLWKQMIANSKFVEMPDFGLSRKGHIALQDHGDPVYFKNIKIRQIAAN